MKKKKPAVKTADAKIDRELAQLRDRVMTGRDGVTRRVEPGVSVLDDGIVSRPSGMMPISGQSKIAFGRIMVVMGWRK